MQASCVILPAGKTVQLELFELVPDVRVHARPHQVRAPRHGVIVWQPVKNEPGKFEPVLETHPAVMDLNKWDEKLMCCSKWQVEALVEAGFVEGERITPRRLNINLDSFFQHRAKVRADFFFWNDEDNRRRYAEAIMALRMRGQKSAARARRKTGASEGGMASGAVNTPPAAENAGNRHGERGENGVRGGGRKEAGSDLAEAEDVPAKDAKGREIL